MKRAGRPAFALGKRLSTSGASAGEYVNAVRNAAAGRNSAQPTQGDCTSSFDASFMTCNRARVGGDDSALVRAQDSRRFGLRVGQRLRGRLGAGDRSVDRVLERLGRAR